MTELYSMTIYLSVTALIILIFKKIFQNKTSARFQVFIWALLFVRIFAPLLPESSFSLFNKVNGDNISRSVYIAQPSGKASAPVQLDNQPSIEKSSAPNQASDTVCSHSDYILILWLMGALGIIAHFSFTYAKFFSDTKKLKNSEDESTLKILAECKTQLGINRKIRIVCGDTPLLAGMFLPTIVLPENLSEKEKRAAIMHELCHLKNNDILLLWISMLILAANWFNPIIWYSFFTFRKDLEMYCDQRVLKYTESKKGYAELLLKTALKNNRFVFGTTSLQNGEKEVSKRIKRIAYFKKPKAVWTVIVLAAAAVISCTCLTNSFSDYELVNMTEYCEQPIGAVMAELDYADSEKIVFHYLNGFFVYNQKSETLETCIDLSKLKTSYNQQGSTVLEVKTSADGHFAYLSSIGPKDEIRGFKNYVIDLETGTVKKGSMPKKTEVFSQLYDSYETLSNTRGWVSVLCAKSNGLTYYLTDEESEIGKLKLVTVETNGAQTEKYIFKNIDFSTASEKKNAQIKDTLGSGAQLLSDEFFSRTMNLDSLTEIFGIIGETPQDLTDAAFDVQYRYIKENNVSSPYLFIFNDYQTKLVLAHPIKNKDEQTKLLNIIAYPNSPLYMRTEEYLRDEFEKVYTPYYNIQSLEITDWNESGNEAVFFYKMTYLNYNRDPDTVEYIKKAKQTNDKNYKILYDDYLALQESNYEFKVEIGGDEKNPLSSQGILKLYTNILPNGEEWVPVKVSDFILK